MTDLETPFTPLEPQGGAAELPTDRPSRSARDIARSIAHDAVAAQEEPQAPVEPRRTQTPGSTFEEAQRAAERPQEPQDSQPEVDEHGLEVTPSVDDVVDDFEAEEMWSTDDFAHFTERGIDLPVPPEDVPEEFRPQYAKMAQALEDIYNSARQSSEKAEMAQGRIDAFSKRMQDPDGQRRVLLSLAFSNPEGFQEAVKTYERMQEDPEFAELVQRRLETDVKAEQLELREQSFTRSQQQTYANQVESRTTRLAERLGVDGELAKQFVVNKLLQTQQSTGKAHITLSEVDDVVKDLARRTGAKPRQRPRKDPQTVQREAQAPTKPTEGAGRTPPAPEEQRGSSVGRNQPESPTLHFQDAIRGAVRTSMKNVRSKGL